MSCFSLCLKLPNAQWKGIAEREVLMHLEANFDRVDTTNYYYIKNIFISRRGSSQ